MSSSHTQKSIIEYHGEYSKTRCGYCKNSASTSISTGFVAHVLTVFDYERCINNGWRRSGRWVYHPTPIESNCCVLCTIRLNVERFEKTSKQKRVERKQSSSTAFLQHTALALIDRRVVQYQTFYSTILKRQSLPAGSVGSQIAQLYGIIVALNTSLLMIIFLSIENYIGLLYMVTSHTKINADLDRP